MATTMPRPDNEATKIAFKVVGKPPVYNFKRPEYMEKLNARLVFEETQRIR